jgi:hypothetical protein
MSTTIIKPVRFQCIRYYWEVKFDKVIDDITTDGEVVITYHSTPCTAGWSFTKRGAEKAAAKASQRHLNNG